MGSDQFSRGTATLGCALSPCLNKMHRQECLCHKTNYSLALEACELVRLGNDSSFTNCGNKSRLWRLGPKGGMFYKPCVRHVEKGPTLPTPKDWGNQRRV